MQIGIPWLLLSAAVLTGCGGKHVTTATAPDIDRFRIEPVLLVPFQFPAGIPEGLRNKKIEAGGAVFLDARLKENLLGMEVEIIPFSGDREDIENPEKPSEALSAEAVRLGRAFKTPAVLFGTVSAFVDRVGSPAGVQSPASVDFSLVLIETENGLVLWKTRFHETQKALFDDLFEIRSFWKRRGRWVTAEELAEFGLEEILRKSPWPGGTH